jgi:DHA2 family multidrug resistance protein
VLRTLPAADRSMGSGLYGVHRGVAMAFGVALCSMILEKRLAVHQVLLSQYHDRFALPVQQALAAFQSLLVQAGEVGNMVDFKSQAALGKLLAVHVGMAAYRDCFLLLSFIFIAAMLPAWLIRTHTPRQPRALVPTESAPAARTPTTTASPSG